jgi:hypothetical protein
LAIDEYVTIKVNVSLATDLEDVKDGEHCNTTKLLRDGQLVIRRNGVEYNTCGMRLETTR